MVYGEATLADPFMSHPDRQTIDAEKVLVLDSSIFIKEIGLMSNNGSALKHYLCSSGTKLIVPQAAAEEYERHLTKMAKDKVAGIQSNLGWLKRFFREIDGWPAPADTVIEGRASDLATGNRHWAIFLEEAVEIRERAERRYSEERPPGHTKKATLGDCRIWEQCLELLLCHDVVFVSRDGDFLDRTGELLHPQLDKEAREIGSGRTLTFYSDMVPLLQNMRNTIAPISNDQIFDFIYDSTNLYSPTSEAIRNFLSNTECRPTKTGSIKQTMLTTEDHRIIEVRLEVKDKWESEDGTKSGLFELRGSCRYHLEKNSLDKLYSEDVGLQVTDPDGSVHGVNGGYRTWQSVVSFSTPPLRAEPTILH